MLVGWHRSKSHVVLSPWVGAGVCSPPRAGVSSPFQCCCLQPLREGKEVIRPRGCSGASACRAEHLCWAGRSRPAGSGRRTWCSHHPEWRMSAHHPRTAETQKILATLEEDVTLEDNPRPVVRSQFACSWFCSWEPHTQIWQGRSENMVGREPASVQGPIAVTSLYDTRKGTRLPGMAWLHGYLMFRRVIKLLLAHQTREAKFTNQLGYLPHTAHSAVILVKGLSQFPQQPESSPGHC